MEAKYCVCLVLFSLLVLFLLMSNGNKETFSSDNGLFCRKDPKICAEEVSCNDVTINEQNKPLGNSVIFVKTVYLDSKPTSKSSWLEIFGSDMDTYRYNSDLTDGYCQKNLTSLENVQNRSICQSKTVVASNKNIGFLYTVVFPVTKPRTYSFDIGMDFGRGGMLVLNGKTLKRKTTDLRNSGELNFTRTLTRGVYILQVYGAEDCCDGKSSWKFKVDDDDWQYVTTENLDSYNDDEVEAENYNVCGFEKVGTVCGLGKDGGKIQNYINDDNVKTFKHCYDLCEQDPNCKSFFWNHYKQKCNLKNVSAKDTAFTRSGRNTVCFDRNSDEYVSEPQTIYNLDDSSNMNQTTTELSNE